MGDNNISDDVIREVFLRNGFTIKEGHDDLKPYVYAAARELISRLQGEAVPVAWKYRAPGKSFWRVTLQGPPVSDSWECEPLYLHPQPAELREVSGDSGELGSASGDLLRRIGLYLSREATVKGSMQAGLLLAELEGKPVTSHAELNEHMAALAATGKQQDTSSWSLHDRVEFALRDAGFNLDEASRIALLVDGKQQVGEMKGDALHISDEDRAVLQRIQDALPTVGLNGWAKGVEVLERLLRDSPASRQQVGAVALYQVRQEIIGEDSLGSSNVRVKERLNAWRDIPKSHYDAYLSLMDGCGPTGVLGRPDGPGPFELNQYAEKTEVRALYAAPPTQGIDLGQFREAVRIAQCVSVAAGTDCTITTEECQRLLDVIDGRDAGTGVE